MFPYHVVTIATLAFIQQEQVGSEIAAVRKELKKSTTILQMDDLKCKKRVLRRYICSAAQTAFDLMPGCMLHSPCVLLAVLIINFRASDWDTAAQQT